MYKVSFLFLYSVASKTGFQDFLIIIIRRFLRDSFYVVYDIHSCIVVAAQILGQKLPTWVVLGLSYISLQDVLVQKVVLMYVVRYSRIQKSKAWSGQTSTI